MIKTWSTPVCSETRNVVPCVLCGGMDFTPYLRCDGFAYVSCRRCSLVQMNPQPDAEAVKRRYSGEDYLEYELANEKPFLNIALLALADAGFYEHEGVLNAGERRSLDVGCATGALAGWLQERGWQAEGVEINGWQADYARQTRGLRVYDRPLEENALEAGRYTLITASHLIEHLRRPRDFLAEARRLLAPGGLLLVITPNCRGFQARLFKKRWRSAIFDHLYLFSVQTLRRLLEQEGFAVGKIVTWGGLAAGAAPQPVKNIVDRLAKRFGFGDVVLAVCRCLARPPDQLVPPSPLMRGNQRVRRVTAKKYRYI